jgi:hypothetical protein
LLGDQCTVQWSIRRQEFPHPMPPPIRTQKPELAHTSSPTTTGGVISTFVATSAYSAGTTDNSQIGNPVSASMDTIDPLAEPGVPSLVTAVAPIT